MPLYPGPWQTPPGALTSAPTDASATVTYDSLVMGYSAPPFSNLCEPTAPVIGTLSNDLMPLTETDLGQLGIDFDLSTPLGGPGWAPPLPWPAGAVAWEFDFSAAPAGAFQPWAHYLDGVIVTAPLEDTAPHGSPDLPATDTLVIGVPVPTSWLSYTADDVPHVGRDGIPGTMLTSPIGSVAFPPTTTTATLTTSLIDPSFIHDLLSLSSAAIPALRLAVAYDNQRSHVSPTGTWRSVHLSGFADATVQFTPPRWRFLFSGRPPLAHRQRRDGTATAGPQLAHIGTAGGRPPLAWRQNNP